MNIMKNTMLFVAIGFLLLLQACYDDYKQDYYYSTTYFARQYPLRTLVSVSGEEMSFEIGAVLGGKYENTINEYVDFEVQDALLNNYPDLVLLPSDYYTIESNRIEISSGKFDGTVKVTIDKEAFVQDQLAVGNNYALPLQIVSATSDSILAEKDFTIIVIRYYNEYHGWYYLKGTDNKLDATGNVVESIVYAQDDLVYNEDFLLTTVAKDIVQVPFIGKYYNDQNTYSMLMTVADGTCTLNGHNTDALSNVAGSGSYDAAERQFTLNYTYADADGATHQVNDVLIYRNTELVLEEWK